jgi:hypothetical protein
MDHDEVFEIDENVDSNYVAEGEAASSPSVSEDESFCDLLTFLSQTLE